MMEQSELIKLIRDEVRKQVMIILSGTSGNNDQFSEEIGNLYPGMTKLPERPVMHPYGFASRAPTGTLQVTGRQGDHPGNRVVLGHRDANRPVMNQGEVILYNAYGQKIELLNGKILIGSGTSAQPFILGNTGNAFLTSLVNLIIAHTHASPGAPPTNIADFTTLRVNNLDNGAILSKEIEGE